jgi:hypothetical protein
MERIDEKFECPYCGCPDVGGKAQRPGSRPPANCEELSERLQKAHAHIQQLERRNTRYKGLVRYFTRKKDRLIAEQGREIMRLKSLLTMTPL